MHERENVVLQFRSSVTPCNAMDLELELCPWSCDDIIQHPTKRPSHGLGNYPLSHRRSGDCAERDSQRD